MMASTAQHGYVVQVMQLLQMLSSQQPSAQERSWKAVFVHGHPDAPCAWRSEPRNSIVSHHSDHDYVVVLLPEGRLLIYALLGKNLPFPGFAKASQHQLQHQSQQTQTAHSSAEVGDTAVHTHMGVEQMQTDET